MQMTAKTGPEIEKVQVSAGHIIKLPLGLKF
jgi:hypothetical protein